MIKPEDIKINFEFKVLPRLAFWDFYPFKFRLKVIFPFDKLGVECSRSNVYNYPWEEVSSYALFSILSGVDTGLTFTYDDFKDVICPGDGLVGQLQKFCQINSVFHHFKEDFYRLDLCQFFEKGIEEEGYFAFYDMVTIFFTWRKNKGYIKIFPFCEKWWINDSPPRVYEDLEKPINLLGRSLKFLNRLEQLVRDNLPSVRKSAYELLVKTSDECFVTRYRSRKLEESECTRK